MSTKDTLTTGLNEAVAKKNTLNLDDYVKAARESVAANRQSETDYINSAYDAANANTRAQHDKALTDTKASYDSEYQKNVVQKLINEKRIAEINANLGLTDSGVNRTQQTAVQLSYANQKGNIDLARQSAIDDLTLNLNAALAESEAGRSGALLTANEKWDNQAYSLGQTNYNNDLAAYNNQISSYAEQLSDIEQAEIDAAAEVQKAAISASESGSNSGSGNDTLLWYFTGTYDDYDNPIFRNSDGKTQAFGMGVNPYKGLMHNDVRDKDGNYDPKKAFSNGYQPNNIGGKKLYAQEEYEVYVNGNKQKVWSYDDGKTLWAWDGSINEYIDVTSRRDELEK